MKKSLRIVMALVLVIATLALSVGAMTVPSAVEAAGTVAEKGAHVAAKSFDPVDISSFKYVHVWLYVSNPALVSKEHGNSEFELTSTGKSDNQEWSWSMKKVDFKEGWNEFYFEIAKHESVQGGDLDLTKFNFTRFYVFGAAAGDLTIKIGNLEFVNELPIETPYALDLSKFGSKSDLGGEYVLEGKSSDIVIGDAKFDAIDLSKYTYMAFDFYISDASALKDGQFELTSSGTCDNQEFTYTFDPSTIKTGWNRIVTPIAKLSKQADADISKIIYSRHYNHVSKEATIKISNVVFGNSENFGIKADYKVVDDAIAAVNAKLDLAEARRIFYSAESVAALDAAIAAVDKNLYADDQAKVDAAAAAITAAADKLVTAIPAWMYYVAENFYLGGNVSIGQYPSYVDFLPFFKPAV